MNGKVQGIIICGVIAASLAGVMVFLNATGDSPQKDESSSVAETTSSKDESVLILDRAEDISTVHITNESGEYTLEKSGSGKSLWTIGELGTVSQNNTLKDSLRDACGNLTAKKLVEENASDMSKYGLDKPIASVTITYSDESRTVLDVGTTAPNERYSYARIQGENSVYMVLGSRLSYFTNPVTAYAELNLIAQPSDEEWPDYGVETITRKDWDYEVTFENDPQDNEAMLSSQVITSPIFSYLNITGSSDVTHGMWGLTASECVVLEPEQEELDEYGLADPFCTVNLKGEGYDYNLLIGDPIKAVDSEGSETDAVTGYYCYLENDSGKNAVYSVGVDSLPWATFEVKDVISNIMTSNYLVDLSEISIEYKGEKTVYEITSNGSSSETLEDGSAADVTSVKCGGKELDIYNFKSLYQFMMTCPTNEIYFTEPEGESEMTIVQTRADGGSDTIELYKDTSRRYIVKLNGKTSFRIQSTWIDTLVKNMDNIKNGKEVDDNY